MVNKISLHDTPLKCITILGLLFLYLPIVVVVLYSFNPDTVNSFPMSGFSFKWYSAMIQNNELITSLLHSVIVAIISTLDAILLGVPAAYVMFKCNFPGKHFFERIVLLPLILPGILTGIALLTFLQILGIQQSMLAVIIGHSTFLIAVVLPQVYTRLKRLDTNVEEAAHDLGANGLQTFFLVVLPNIKTAIISSALLSFTLSLDEIPVTFFLNGVFSTLPIQIWGMTRNGITPQVNAIATLIFVLSLFGIILTNLMDKEGD